MKRTVVDEVAPVVYAALVFVALVAPAVAVELAADRGGMGDYEGGQLLAASVVLGTVQGGLAWGRLRSEERIALRRTDMWIAALDSLVVLALSSTLLLMAVLWGLADEHASLADRGLPVVALWVGIQVVAVVLAEVCGRAVFRWLERPI